MKTSIKSDFSFVLSTLLLINTQDSQEAIKSLRRLKNRLIKAEKQLAKLNNYVRHKPGCGLVCLPSKGYTDDDGYWVSEGGGWAITDKCSCGLSEIK